MGKLIQAVVALGVLVGISYCAPTPGDQYIGGIYGRNHQIVGTLHSKVYKNNGHVYHGPVGNGGVYHQRGKRSPTPGDQYVGGIYGNGHAIIGTSRSNNYNNNGHVYNGHVQHGGAYVNNRGKRSPGDQYVNGIYGNGHAIVGTSYSNSYNNNGHVYNGNVGHGGTYVNNGRKRRSAAPNTYIGTLGASNTQVVQSVSSETYNGHSVAQGNGGGAVRYSSSGSQANAYGDLHNNGQTAYASGYSAADSQQAQQQTQGQFASAESGQTQYQNSDRHIYNGNLAYGGTFVNSRAKRSPGDQYMGSIGGNGHLIVGTQYSNQYGNNGHVYNGNVGHGGLYVNNRGKRSPTPGDQHIGGIYGQNHQIVGTLHSTVYGHNGHVYHRGVGNGGTYINRRGKRSPGNQYVNGIYGNGHAIVGTSYSRNYNNNGHVYNGNVGHGGTYVNNGKK